MNDEGNTLRLWEQKMFTFIETFVNNLEHSRTYSPFLFSILT